VPTIAAFVPAFTEHLHSLEAAFARKQDLVVNVASMAGALSNSRRALFRLGDELARCVSELRYREIRDVLDNVAQYALLEDESLREQASMRLAATAQHPPDEAECRPLLDGFVAHSRLLLHDQPLVRRDLIAVTELPTRQAISALLDDSWRFEQASRASLRWVSVGLLGLTFVLGWTLYRAFERLEIKGRLIREANESLEITVQRRTEELRRSNERLEADIAERERAERERDAMAVRLMQAQKLEAVGQLAAGIAHEINTPIQFVNDSVYFVRDATRDLARIVEEQRRLTQGVLHGTATAADATHVVELEQETDLDYLIENVPDALDRAIEGLGRVATIVQSMKEFSHPGGKQKEPADLNRAIRSTVTVARNEWKYVAEVETDLDPTLPMIPCMLGDLNQTILNLVVNAAHAIAEIGTDDGDHRGTIRISTAHDDAWAIVRVADTGCGIPADIRERIFEPFFTTKEVGKGTGQGLSLAHNVVVREHGGSIDIESEVGSGTTFTIRLPLDPGRCDVEPALAS
jgi:C4-dicarboxylate-specific signal transduction histidine kinase